jgi:hypothetical protein
MVHPDARNGDQIAWLRGCSIPVVLRDKCKIIGGAYFSNVTYEDLRSEGIGGFMEEQITLQ